MSLGRINDYLMCLFVFSLPLTAFSVLSFFGKSVIFSWFLIFLLGIINFKKIIKSFYMPKAVYSWFLTLFLSIIAFLLFRGLIFGKNFTQILNVTVMLIHLPVLYSVLRDKNFKEINKLIKLLVYGSLILALFTFYQCAGHYLAYLPAFDFLRNANIYNIYRGTGIEGWSGTYRVSGTAPEPGYWAAYLLIPIAFLLPYFFYPNKFFIKKTIFLVLLASFFLTFGRTGWVGLVVMLLFCPLVSRVPIKIKYAYLAGALALSAVAFGLVANGLVLPKIADASYSERISSVEAAFDIFSSNAFFGVGFGSFDEYARGLGDPVFNYSVVHNFYIRLLVETGIFGIVAFIALIAFFFFKIIKCIKLSSLTGDRDQIYFSRSLALAFISILVFWFFVPGYNFSYIWFVISLIGVLPVILKKRINLVEQ